MSDPGDPPQPTPDPVTPPSPGDPTPAPAQKQIKTQLQLNINNTFFFAPSVNPPKVRYGKKAGISFDFPPAKTTPPTPFDCAPAYLTFRPKRPLKGGVLCFALQLVGGDGRFHYMSDGWDNPPPGPGIAPAGITTMITSCDLRKGMNDNIGMRWFSRNTQAALADLMKELPVVLQCPLVPAGWTGVTNEDPVVWKNGLDFKNALATPAVNVTLCFGGGYYAGHGVVPFQDSQPTPITLNVFEAYILS